MAVSTKSTRNLYDVLEGDDAAAPIIDAVTKGDNAALKELLSRSNVLMEKQVSIYSARDGNVMARPIVNAQRALEIAIVNGHADVVGTLMDNGAVFDSSLRTAVQLAIKQHFDVFEVLAARVNLINYDLGHGNTPLDVAMTDRVPRLLEMGAEPSRSTFEKAAMRGNVAMLELLGVPFGRALHCAARVGNLENMKWLIERGANVNAIGLGMTPLHDAALFCQVDAMELLRQHGAVEKEDRQGRIPTVLLEERLREKREREERG